MLRTKTIDIINTFSAEEFKAMSAFIKSPYFNSNKNLVKLYEALRKSFPLIKEDKISEEDIFRKIFPGKKYNYGIMKNLTSALFGLLEEFLLFNNIKNSHENKFGNPLRVAREYDARLLDGYFKKTIKKLKEEMDSSLIHAEYYRNMTELEEQEYFFHSSRTDDLSLQDAVYNEAIYSIADFFRKISRSLWKVQIIEGNVNSKYDIDLKKIIAGNIDFEKITENLKSIDEKIYTNIKLNTLLIKLLTDGLNMDHYNNIKKLLFEKIDLYDNYERLSIFTKVISYCAVMFEEGRAEFLPESLVIQKLMLLKVRFRESGLGPYNFHNFIELAHKFIHEDQVEEAENLVKGYIGWLEDDKQQLAHDLIKALICIELGRNDEAIEHIKKIKPHDTFVKMLVRKIYIEAYYELGSFEQGFDMIASFKTFVREKNDLDAYTKNTHLNSLKIFEKLFKIKCSPEKYNVDDVNRLEKEIMENNYVNKKWQLRKTRELKNVIK
ncbi:MAG: hypothetical protein ABI543_11360 [Ignavibacteria bacterium]